MRCWDLVLTFVSHHYTYSAGWKLYHAVLGQRKWCCCYGFYVKSKIEIRTCNTGIDGLTLVSYLMDIYNVLMTSSSSETIFP